MWHRAPSNFSVALDNEMSVGPRHRELHQEYVGELRQAVSEVREWWDALVARTVEITGSRIAAATELERRWPVGPSAHPRILGVIAKYYVACEMLNLRLRKEMRTHPEAMTAYRYAETDGSDDVEEEPDAPVPPGVFVGEMLASAATRDLQKVVFYLKYWPVGVDETGQFV